MPKLGEVISTLLPDGSSARHSDEPVGSADYVECPVWPPDAFAVAATIVERSACYVRDRYSGRGEPRGEGAKWEPFFGRDYLARVCEAGRAWRQEMRVPRPAREAWQTLVESREQMVGRQLGDAAADAAIELMAIADEACVGVGFALGSPSPIAAFVLEEHLRFASKEEPALIPDVRTSLCVSVPGDRACVQPKSRCTQVGSSMRALSHHVTLVPPRNEVETRWMVGSLTPPNGPFNLLLVPFPYRLRGDAVIAGPKTPGDGHAGHFRIAHTWLPEDVEVAIENVASLLAGLVREAERELGAVHGVVLPELALTSPVVRGVARSLASIPTLEVFISGSSAINPRSGAPRNLVFGSLLGGGQVRTHWWQSKHHRWRLDERQIRRYHLGHRLEPHCSWWEDIDVDGRELSVYVFRPGSSIAVLVCEDLARIDPVQPVLRALGPTLVIAVLLDGPQLDKRWSGRYAGALADDPGCSVLTLSSLGMMERSVSPGEPAPRQIALFKDASGAARELSLPRDSHALAISLDARPQTRFTLDGRSDGERTSLLSLGAVRGVRFPGKLPDWVES